MGRRRATGHMTVRTVFPTSSDPHLGRALHSSSKAAASRPSLRLPVLQPSVAGRRQSPRSGAGRSQLHSPSGLHGSVVTSLHSSTVQFVRPLRTDVRIRADLSRALSLSGLGSDALP
jgi:hypothetical protein